nr:unnamed protein product [Digitaria exilis]
MRVRSAHEGREVDEINARDVPHAGRVERVHGQTRARGDAEGARGLAEEAHPAERGEGRRGEGRASADPARGRPELGEAEVGVHHAAGCGVAGGAREWRQGQRRREEEDEWRNSCSSAAVATAAMAIDTRFSSRRTCPSVAPVRLVGAVEGGAAPRDATRNEWAVRLSWPARAGHALWVRIFFFMGLNV